MKKNGGEYQIAPDFLVLCTCLVAIITVSPCRSLPLPSNLPVDGKLTAVEGKPAGNDCDTVTSTKKVAVVAEKGRKKLINAKEKINVPEGTLNATINAPV